MRKFGQMVLTNSSQWAYTRSMERDRLVTETRAEGGAETELEREAAEDDESAGRRALDQLHVNQNDAVVLVSAGGRSPFVFGAASAAGASGAYTACIVSALGSELAALCDDSIDVVVGP